jgi:hypothetical protein
VESQPANVVLRKLVKRSPSKISGALPSRTERIAP